MSTLTALVTSILIVNNTVKLGYNDHSYNEFTFIAKKYCKIFGPKWQVAT